MLPQQFGYGVDDVRRCRDVEVLIGVAFPETLTSIAMSDLLWTVESSLTYVTVSPNDHLP